MMLMTASHNISSKNNREGHKKTKKTQKGNLQHSLPKLKNTYNRIKNAKFQPAIAQASLLLQALMESKNKMKKAERGVQEGKTNHL